MDAETNSELRRPESLVPMSEYTMDEAQIMYDYCGIVIEDFAPFADEDSEDAALAEELENRLKNPGFTKALLHVSYQRANPRVSEAKIRRFFGTMDRVEAMERFLELVPDEQEDEAGPPASTTEPEQSSQKSSVTSSESSGPTSTPSSDPPADLPATTGTDGSTKPSPQSAPMTLVP